MPRKGNYLQWLLALSIIYLMNSIQIFACDHRTGIQWDLPYIRLGSKCSDAAINIKNDAQTSSFDPSMSEGAQILYVSKHYAEFGNPDVVGFFHYRRFLSLAIDRPIVDMPKSSFGNHFCIKPLEMLSLIAKNECVGASMFPIPVVNVRTEDDKLVWNQMVAKEPNLKDVALCKKLFDIFAKNSPDTLKDHVNVAFRQHRQYLCNIFVLCRKQFDELCQMMFPSLIEFAKVSGDFFEKNFHPRWLGYFCERLVSCYLYALQFSGKKILHLPLATVDCSRHNHVEKDPVTGLIKEIRLNA